MTTQILLCDSNYIVTGMTPIPGGKSDSYLGKPVAEVLSDLCHIQPGRAGEIARESLGSVYKFNSTTPTGSRLDNHVSAFQFNGNAEGGGQYALSVQQQSAQTPAHQSLSPRSDEQLLASEHLSTMASGIAHEFNNLLMPILGMTEIVISELPEGSQHVEYLSEVIAASMKAKELVQQMLLFSKDASTQIEPTDLMEFINAGLATVMQNLPANIQISCVEELEVQTVPMDSEQMQLVLQNVCRNSIEAMDEQGGDIQVRCRKVNKEEEASVGLAGDGIGWVCIEVKDRGRGIEPGNLKMVFTPFFTTKEIGSGTGLGLSAVKGIIDVHNGHTHIESTPGEGTSIFLYLPLSTPGQKDGEDLTEGSHAEAEMQEEEVTNHHKILLVDDEKGVNRTSTLMLERVGHKVDPYLDPLEAMEKLLQDPQAYSLIFTDISMPGMDGMSLALKARQAGFIGPIILITGNVDGVNLEEAHQAKVTKLLTKPIRPVELYGVLDQIPPGTTV